MSRPCDTRFARRGFTLVELLLAMTLTSVIAGSALAALDQFVEADTRAVVRTEQTLDILRTLQLFRRDVRTATDIVVATRQWTLSQSDGTAVVYVQSADGVELHRFAGAPAAVQPSATAILTANAAAAEYSTRGHLCDRSWSGTALLQDVRSLDVIRLTSSVDGELIGLQLAITTRVDGIDQRAVATAMSRALAESHCKP